MKTSFRTRQPWRLDGTSEPGCCNQKLKYVDFWFLPRPTNMDTDTNPWLRRVKLKNLEMQKLAWSMTSGAFRRTALLLKYSSAYSMRSV